MLISSVSPEHLGSFIEAAGSPDNYEEVAQYLQRMFAAGSMRPEWCFIAEEGDRPYGRVAFWTPPPSSEQDGPGSPEGKSTPWISARPRCSAQHFEA
jgi:hypothetical protein